MGDIADMMLDGTLCEGCGSYIEGDGEGFPRYCSDQCAKDRGAPVGGYAASDRYEPRVPRFNRYGKQNTKIAQPSDPIRQGDKMTCPFCVRKVKRAGFGDHMLAQHRDKWSIPGDVAQITEGNEMPVYRITIKGRNKPILTKADTAAKARDLVVDAVALTAEEMADALGDGEKLWSGSDDLPADDPDPTETGPGDKPKAEAKDASDPESEPKPELEVKPASKKGGDQLEALMIREGERSTPRSPDR